MMRKCCYNKDLCSFLKCPIHFSKKIMTPDNSRMDTKDKMPMMSMDHKKDLSRSLYHIEVRNNIGPKSKDLKSLAEMENEPLPTRYGKYVKTKDPQELKPKREFRCTSGIKLKSITVSSPMNRKIECYFAETQNSEKNAVNILSDNTANTLRSKVFCSVDYTLYERNVKYGKVFTCSLCDDVFENKKSLAKHKKIHNFCKYCKTKFKSLKSLNYHSKKCIFQQCLTSQPKVWVIDIAKSKNPQLSNKFIFQNNLPDVAKLKDVKQEIFDIPGASLNLSESQLDITNVKIEDISEHDQSEADEKNIYSYNYSYDYSNVKSESIEVEDQEILFDIECVKKEDIFRFVETKDDANDTNILGEIVSHREEKTTNRMNVINSKKELSEFHEMDQLSLSDYEEYRKKPRFSRFESEIENMHADYIKDEGSLTDERENSGNIVCENELKKSDLACVSSNNSNNLKDNLHDFVDEKSRVNIHLHENTSKCVYATDTKHIEQKFLSKNNEALSIFADDINIPKTEEISEKSVSSPKTRFIRFTTKPNLNLFIF